VKPGPFSTYIGRLASIFRLQGTVQPPNDGFAVSPHIQPVDIVAVGPGSGFDPYISEPANGVQTRSHIVTAPASSEVTESVTAREDGVHWCQWAGSLRSGSEDETGYSFVILDATGGADVYPQYRRAIRGGTVYAQSFLLREGNVLAFRKNIIHAGVFLLAGTMILRHPHL